MGSSLSVCNNTNHHVHVILEQVGPLYDVVLRPGETHTFEVGRVWFSVRAACFVHQSQNITTWKTLRPMLFMSTGCVLAVGGAVALAPVVGEIVVGSTLLGGGAATTTIGALSGATSSAYGWIKDHFDETSNQTVRIPMYACKRGVYADGKTVYIEEVHNSDDVRAALQGRIQRETHADNVATNDRVNPDFPLIFITNRPGQGEDGIQLLNGEN